MLLATLFVEIYCVKEVEQNPVPKSQTKPFYIGTKEAPSDIVTILTSIVTTFTSIATKVLSVFVDLLQMKMRNENSNVVSV